MYKLSEPRYSSFYGCEVVDILERKKAFGFISYWGIYETHRNHSALSEVVYLLNNPSVVEERLKEAVEYLKKLNKSN